MGMLKENELVWGPNFVPRATRRIQLPTAVPPRDAGVIDAPVTLPDL